LEQTIASEGLDPDATGGAIPAAQAAAEAAAAEAVDAEASALPEDLDEFGRDRNVEKRREAVRRRVSQCSCLMRCTPLFPLDYGMCYVRLGETVFWLGFCSVHVSKALSHHLRTASGHKSGPEITA
jgi:hypothetical protein